MAQPTSSFTTTSRALARLAQQHETLPVDDFAIKRLCSLPDLAIGIAIHIHDDLGAFEVWREALHIAPAEVTLVQHRSDPASGFTVLRGGAIFEGVPIELVGYGPAVPTDREVAA